MSSIDDRPPGRVTAAIRARWQREPHDEVAPAAEEPGLDEAITKLADGLSTEDSGRLPADPGRTPPTMITSAGVDEARAYVAPIAPVEHRAQPNVATGKVRIGPGADPRHLETEVIQRPQSRNEEHAAKASDFLYGISRRTMIVALLVAFVVFSVISFAVMRPRARSPLARLALAVPPSLVRGMASSFAASASSGEPGPSSPPPLPGIDAGVPSALPAISVAPMTSALPATSAPPVMSATSAAPNVAPSHPTTAPIKTSPMTTPKASASASASAPPQAIFRKED